jgi:hypothetical protein
MEHSSSINPPLNYAREERELLLSTAADSIDYGLSRGEPFPVVPENFPAPLQEQRAAFVTLRKQGELRGCIGSVEAVHPLIKDVAINSYKSAFGDPRFSKLKAEETESLHISISILTTPVHLLVSSEAELIAELRPGTDGLILEEGDRRATFLPSVWESIPIPEQFIFHLRQKGGWPDGYWSGEMACYTYAAVLVE